MAPSLSWHAHVSGCDKVRLSAQPPADRSVQRLMQRRRWTAPADCWAARRCSGTRLARQHAQQRLRLASPPCPPMGTAVSTGAAALCPCRYFLSPRNPLSGALRIAYRSWRSAAVPLLPRVLCGRSSLLASVWNVMPQGSCVKAWPRSAHQQDGYRSLTTSEGRMAYQAGCGTGGPRSHAWRVPGPSGAHVCRTRCGRGLACSVEATCPHTPRASLRSQGRSSGLSLAGLCAADRDAVEGVPWPGRRRGWAELGGRSPGLPLAAAVLPA
jgi:hypothetical protein